MSSTWLQHDSSAAVYEANIADHDINLPRRAIVSQITPMVPIDTAQLSRVVADPDTHGHSRVQLQRALTSAFRYSAFTKVQQQEVLDIRD